MFSFLKEFDMAALLPEMSRFESQLAWWMRIILVVGPLAVVCLGLIYFFIPPDAANKHLGYRSKWSMQSVAQWQRAQKVAGMVYMILGGAMLVLMVVMAILLSFMKPLGMAVVTVVCVLAQVVLVVCSHIIIEKILHKAE